MEPTKAAVGSPIFQSQSPAPAFNDLESVHDTSKGSPGTTHVSRMPGLQQEWLIILQKCGAELISTFILVLGGCGAVVADASSNGQLTHVGVAIAFGLVVAIMIYTVGHISGCHMNPAVSIALASIGQMKWNLVLFYILSQCVGATFAGFALRVIFTHGHHDLKSFVYLGATFPSDGDAQSLVVEILATFILMFVVAGVATDERAAPGFAGIAVGGAIAVDAMFAGPISGASMNPARSLGPALAANFYQGFWVYIIGPIIGALGGAWAYVLIRIPPPQRTTVQTSLK